MRGSALGQTWSSIEKCIIIMNPWVVRWVGASRARQQSGQGNEPFCEGRLVLFQRRLKI